MNTMLHRLLLTGLLIATLGQLVAQNSMVPSAMSYQGVLTDDNGNPVAPTTPENRNIEFRIYNQAAGGTVLWAEAQTVTVFKGNFSVVLGNGTALSGAPSGPAAFSSVFTNATSADLYFGITPQGSAEFAPRQKLLASAFALRAKTAETVNATAQSEGVPSQFNWLTANNLEIKGHTKITGTNLLEFGFNIPNKASSAGMIGYNQFGVSGLSIVGGGDTVASRKLTLWAEGGVDLKGPITFPSAYGQWIRFWDGNNGLGIQSDGTHFARAANQFAWYRASGGIPIDPTVTGPGASSTQLARLSLAGLELSQGKFTGDGSGLTNVPIPSTVNNLALNGTISKNGHGTFIDSFGEGHSIGSQDFTTYARTARNFAWYLNGSHNGGELNAGGGTRLMTLTGGGLALNVGSLSLETGSVNLGNRLGQHINLHGNTYGAGIQNSTLYLRTGGAYSIYVGGTHADNARDAGGGVEIANWDGARFDFYRRLYIGPGANGSSPPLEIAGSTGAQGVGAIARFFKPPGNGAGYDGQSNYTAFFGLSIRATGGILGAEFIATSDLRLKLPEGRSDAAKDLVTLGGLEVTDYTLKDISVGGGRKQKKLIAQQVEKVYPQAVSRTTGTVPDIYRMAVASNGVIAFKEANVTDLKAGQTIRLVQGERDFSTEVTGATKAGFTVKESIKDGELFVYGRKVEDLRTVDYEAISMLNVSATQELTRQLHAQAAALAEVQKERDAYAKEVAELRAATRRQDERLARMEAAVEAVARHSTAPAAVQVKLDRK